MNCGDTGKGASRHNPASRDSAEHFMSEMLRGRGYFQHGSTTERHHSLCCRIVLKTTLTAGGTPRQRRMERRPPPLTFFRSSLVTMRGRQSLTAPSLLSPCSLRSRLRRPMRHGGGRGAEEKVRGAEPSGGFAARRRKRAGRGYMLPFARVEHGLPLRQRTLPPMPQQRHTLRTTPSTLFCNRAPANHALTPRRAEAYHRKPWFSAPQFHRGFFRQHGRALLLRCHSAPPSPM